MAEQDTARTIIFDLVQLEKLGAELERRYRINPTTRVTDVLTHIDPEDHILYVPQLTKLLEDLSARGNTATLDVPPEALEQTIDIGDSLHRSLMATALVEGFADDSGQPLDKPSDKTSGKVTSKSAGGTPLQPEAMPERIDQFRILRELGAGAFGVVYLAEDESLQRKVAIKVPKVSDPARSASYINEARKAAAIDCKGIVPIYHVGTKENGVPFVVQKLIDGPSLRFLLTRYGTLPPAHAVTLMRDISIALASAHRLGIYHRDLKPDNILIDGSGVPWIADFGLAISESEQAQRKGEIAGTLMYMSPEQIQGRADWLDGRSDIWALGIMLHELLLGKPPFSGKNRQSLMEQICHREPRPLQQSSPELTAINDVFNKCCAKSPSDRYASVEELARDLDFLIVGGLSTSPIDGTELRFEQPISQYPSNDSHGTRSGVGSAFAGTLASARAGTTRSQTDTASSNQLLATQPGSSISGPPVNSSHSSVPGTSVLVTTKAEKLTRFLAIAVGVSSIVAVGAQQWVSRQNSNSPNNGNSASANVATVDPTQELIDAIEEAKSGKEQEGATVGNNSPAVNAGAEPGREMPTNALTLAEANGSEKLPWVVAADGSGSHRSISDAVAASEHGAFINIKPGVYSESLKLTQPVHLRGQGETAKCIVSSDQNTPIEVACGFGTVHLANLSIEGKALQAGKQFNAVEVVSGRAKIENCLLKTSTYNGVKLKAGASLEAVGCQFLESNDYAISGLDHIEIVIDQCEFFQAGVQAVGGPMQVRNSVFHGSEGVYVGKSSEIESTIDNCDFESCLEYGAVITEISKAAFIDCDFSECKFGLRTFDSDVAVSKCKFSGSLSAAVDVTGGKVRVADSTEINQSRNFGCSVSGGMLQMEDCSFLQIATAGVIARGVADIQLSNTSFNKCGSCAVDIVEGKLSVTGGLIEACQQFGVYLSDKFTGGSVTGTRFANNPGAAFCIESGTMDLQDLSIDGSEIGLLVRAIDGLPVKVTLRESKFSNISDVPVDVEGAATMDIFSTDFGAIPAGEQFRALGEDPRINLHL